MAALLTPAQIASVEAMNRIMAQDENGDDVYNNERAILGYIKEHEKLRVVQNHLGRVPIALNVRELGTQEAVNNHIGPIGDAWRVAHPYLPPIAERLTDLSLLKIAILNARALMEAVGGDALSVERATLIGLLRARWLLIGCLYPDARARITLHDEVRILDETDAIWIAIDLQALHALGNVHVTAILTFLSTPPGLELARWATNNAELVWSMSEHLMRSRGHHYKSEYDTMIDKMYSSSSSGNVSWPINVNRCDALRTAIHPFGIKALPVMTYFFAWHGKLGPGMMRRLTGASNGFSAATTAYAGIGMISSETWFHQFMQIYGTQMSMITAFARAMLDDRYSFHESAGLYGLVPRRSIEVDGKVYSMTEVDTAVTAIAPILQGFIQWSSSQAMVGQGAVFAFANAKVLAKRSSNNPVAVARTVALLTSMMTHIEDAENSAASINEAFPMLMNGNEGD